MNIGHRIKAAREVLDMSQRDLAAAVRVSAGLVGQWENHSKMPGRANLQKVAKVLLVSTDMLLYGTGPLVQRTVIERDAELLLLSRFRRMTPLQQDTLLEFSGISARIGRQAEHKNEPAQPERPVRRLRSTRT